MSRTATSNNANRADQVRKRRTTRSRAHVERATRSISNAPSVTTRDAGVGRPVLQRTATRPRRVYTVAFQQSGRAYSVPAPTIRVGWRALSTLLVLGMLFLLMYALNAEQFKVDKPTIEGASRISANDIEAVLKLNGESVFTIDPWQARLELEQAYPELQNVSVLVGLPNTVSVQFSERQPVLAWKQKDMTRWIDANGTIFAARGEAPKGLLTVVSNDDPPLYEPVPTPGPTPEATPTPSAPATEVNSAPARMDLNILSSALLLSSHMPPDTNLVYSQKEGLGWHDPRGWDVYFGKTLDDLEKKISMYEAIVKQLEQKGITPSYINLESLYAPFYRLEH